jgi:trk system potassium uptake protein TrkA
MPSDRMDVVIVGAGEVGHHLADILSREEHRVSVIDPDPIKSQRLMESLDVQMIIGDGARANVLTQAGTSRAQLFVAVTDNDRVNMLACVLARQLGARRIILRLKNLAPLIGYRYFYKQALGFDVILSSHHLAAEEVLRTVRQQNALEVETFAEGRIQLRRLRVREGSELTRDPIAGLSLPEGVVVVAVAGSERFVVPDGESQLQVGDQIYVMGETAALDAFEQLAGERPSGSRSVVIMGAGLLGREVARGLSSTSEIAIRVIESDLGRADTMASAGMPNVLVLTGDATDLDLLLEERIGEADVFIATSGDDERNMVACQLARSLGVGRTVALVNKASYRQIYDLLGIDMAISPRILVANTILRAVRAESVAAISVIGEGKAEVLELEARMREARGGVKIKNLGLPKGAVIGAVVRGDEVIVPNGDVAIESGDHVIVFTLPENLQQVEAVFGAR